MPYLPTSQAFLEQSSLLLEAYPETTRITTKYSFPSTKSRRQQAARAKTRTKTQAQGQTDESTTTTTSTTPTTPTAAVASLTLKTFDPTSGICLKYRTNKVAEVGRLITTLGNLAKGEKQTADVLAGSGGAAVKGRDVEMMDAGAGVGAGAVENGETSIAAAAAGTATTGQPTGGAAKGGKGKKKGGKGKR